MLQISTIKRLLPRLRSLSFMLRYEELVQDIKPDIVAATAACEEVKSSKKFARILELILLLGNYMNSGSKNGQAFGFEISFLTKVCSAVYVLRIACLDAVVQCTFLFSLPALKTSTTSKLLCITW